MRHILLIDDDVDDREFFCEVLGGIDQTITCDMALNGIEGLAQLENGKTPDIIFLDLNMPHMNGFDFLSKFRESSNFNAIPVVIYTTSNQPQDMEKARASGAQAFFSKPSSLQLLEEKLRKLLSVDFSECQEFLVF